MKISAINRAACATWFLALLWCAPAWAHDLYLTYQRGAICAGVGENFPESEDAITAERLERFAVRRDGGAVELKGEVRGTQFCAKYDGPRAAIAELAVHPRFIKLEAKLFNEYLAGEGLKHVLAARQKSGETNAPGRELYSKYSKLLMGSAEGWQMVTPGHALEIIPQMPPALLKTGEALPVLLMFKGKPLADAQVAAVYAGADLSGHKFPVVTRTNAQGRARLKLDRPGLWYARAVYMAPAQDDPDVDWRSFFATITFAVGEN